MSFWLMIIIIVVVITGGQVISQAIDAFSRRGLPLPRGGGGAGEEEVRRLREQVETLADRVERLQEEQRFLTGLLEERPARRLEERPAPRLEE